MALEAQMDMQITGPIQEAHSLGRPSENVTRRSTSPSSSGIGWHLWARLFGVASTTQALRWGRYEHEEH